MNAVVLGTAGHVDHGKTALVRALTGIDTDRWEEERRRGITIDLGFAPLPLPEVEAELSIVDVPGHEDLVKNMLAGATGVDLVLLVVAADEGPMPQTSEHLWIARYLGIHRGIVAITKRDLVEPAWLDLIRDSVREELRRILGRDDWPVVATSSETGEGIADLREVIASLARDPSARRERDLFRLPVDRCFTVRGFGTVVTGTVWSGQVVSGAEVTILPWGQRARVRGLQVHGSDVRVVRAGQRAALALAGIERERVRRGAVLCDGGPWRTSRLLDVIIEVSPDSARPIEHWQRLRVHLGTAETMARVALYDDRPLTPGSRGPGQLRLERPLVARGDDAFVLRLYSPVTTIGGGRVLDPWARHRGREAGLSAARVRRLAAASDPERVAAMIVERPQGVELTELEILTGKGGEELERVLRLLEGRSLVRRLGERWFDGGAIEAAGEEALQVLREGHRRRRSARGVGLEELRAASDRPKGVIDEALRELSEQGLIRLEGSVAALAGHVPALTVRQEELAAAALPAIRAGGLAPPRLADLAATLGVETGELVPVLSFLVREGRVVAVTSDLFLDRETLEAAGRRVVERLQAGAASPSELREVLGVSRKYLIPLLEHLDARGLTRRIPGGRVLREGG